MPQCTMTGPIGLLTVIEENGALTAIRFGGEAPTAPTTELLRQAQLELEEYFSGTRTAFTLPLAPQGTAFQKRVWDALLTVPYGETRTYGQIAAAVGNSKASRAVGSANHCNPLPIVIPCHRVIGAGGRLTGYAGGLSIKEYLLQLEQK